MSSVINNPGGGLTGSTGGNGGTDSGKAALFGTYGDLRAGWFTSTSFGDPTGVTVAPDSIQFYDASSDITTVYCAAGSRDWTFPAESGSLNVASREWCRADLFCVKRLAANEDRVATTTLAALTALDVTLAVGNYYFRYWMDVGQTSTGGFKWDMTFSGTATVLAHLTMHDQEAGTGAVALIRKITAFSSAVSVGTSATTAFRAMVEGVINVTAAGTMSLRFAQNTAAGTGTVRANSVVTLAPIP